MKKHAHLALGYLIFAAIFWIADLVDATSWLTWIALLCAALSGAQALGHAVGSAMRSKASNDNGGSHDARR